MYEQQLKYYGQKDPVKLEGHKKVTNYLSDACHRRELDDGLPTNKSAVKDLELRKALADPSLTETERVNAVKRRSEIIERQAKEQEHFLNSSPSAHSPTKL